MYWFDGQWQDKETITLNVGEPGLLYGATAFTTLRVYEGNLEHPLSHWPHHQNRLEQTTAQWGWPAPDWQQLTPIARQLAKQFSVLRLTLFADGKAWLLGKSLPPHLHQQQRQGRVAVVAEPQGLSRSLADFKTGNYLAPWLLAQQAQQQGAQEGILVNAQGNWLETCTGNLWAWGQGVYWTPPLDGQILPGVTRGRLLQYLQAQSQTVRQDPWTPDLVQSFTAIAYSNSVLELMPLRQILTPTGPLEFRDFSGLRLLQNYFMDTAPSSIT